MMTVVGDILCAQRIFKDKDEDLYKEDIGYQPDYECPDLFTEVRVPLVLIQFWENYVTKPSCPVYKTDLPLIVIVYTEGTIKVVGTLPELDKIMQAYFSKNLLTFKQ